MSANEGIDKAFALEANEEGLVPFESAVLLRMLGKIGMEVSRCRLDEAMEGHDQDTMSLLEFHAFVADLAEPGEEKENDEEVTALLRLIDTRFETKVFPAVQPNEVPEEQVSIAIAAIDLVRKTEHVRIQSYIDTKYAEFRELLPDEDASEPLVKARWARDTYYYLVKEMMTLMAEEGLAFVPEVRPEDLDSAAQDEATTILRTLSPERVPMFLEQVRLKWSTAVLNLPPLMQTEAFQNSEKGKGMKKKWMHKFYYPVMKECVSNSDFSSPSSGEVTRPPALSFTYKPALKIDELSAAEKEKAALLYLRVTEDIARKIEEEVRKQSKDALLIVPDGVSAELRERMYRKWLHASYLQIVSKCVEAGASPEPFVFVPDVAVESLAEEAQRTRAQALVHAVGAEDVCQIEEAVGRRRKEWEEKMPSWMIEISAEVWEEMLRGEYYDNIESILAKKRGTDNLKKGSGRRKEKRSSEMAAPQNAMAFSPGKRMRSQSSSNAMEFLEACEFHLREQCVGEEYAFEGYLLYAPETTKTVELTDYKTHSKKKDTLLAFLLADHSAPLLCKFWNKTAGQALTKLAQWRAKNPEEETIRVRITRVSAQKERVTTSTLVTPRRVLSSSDKTTFECVHTFQQGSEACVERSIHEEMFLSCFDRMRTTKVPFEVSLAGKIFEVGSERKSRDGTPMIDFSLQDQTGLYVQCVAHGRHADSGVLEEDQEIIVFSVRLNLLWSRTQPAGFGFTRKVTSCVEKKSMCGVR